MSEIYISIIICCYNSEEFLLETLDSIKKQTYNKFEIIIINDGSQDDTDKLINEFIKKNIDLKIKYISQNNKGLSNSRNLAVSLSSYDYIALLDHDDLWINSKLEKQVSHISNNMDCDLFFSDFFYLNASHKEKTRFEIAEKKDFYNPVNLKLKKINCYIELARKGCFIGTSSVIFNKNALKKNQLFDPNYQFLTDYLFFLDIAKISNFFCSKEILSYWRSHSSQATLKMSKIHYHELSNLYFGFYFSNLLSFIDKIKIFKKHCKLLIKILVF